MLNVGLAGDHLYGKLLFTAGDVYDGVFCIVFFPRDVLDEIRDLIESVSEGFSFLLFQQSIFFKFVRTSKDFCVLSSV